MIRYICIFIFAFALLQLIISLVNFLFGVRLRTKANPNLRERISILIPARNEEENIGLILSDLIKTGDSILEIIVFDDESRDRTPNIVEEFALKDNRIRLVKSPGLEEGFMGKNFACHKLSLEARSNYLLFLDSDVRIKNKVIERSLAYIILKKLDLLSIFPFQNMQTIGEKVSVPNMNFILNSLLPLPLVFLSNFHSLSAANGQFMLFKQSIIRN